MEDEYILHIWHRSVEIQRIAIRLMFHGFLTFKLDSILDLSECHLCLLNFPLSKSDPEIYNNNKIPLAYRDQLSQREDLCCKTYKLYQPPG